MTFSVDDIRLIKTLSRVQLCWCRYAECRDLFIVMLNVYAECHYAECRCAVCRGAAYYSKRQRKKF
jgi:hypothetical protein